MTNRRGTSRKGTPSTKSDRPTRSAAAESPAAPPTGDLSATPKRSLGRSAGTFPVEATAATLYEAGGGPLRCLEIGGASMVEEGGRKVLATHVFRGTYDKHLFPQDKDAHVSITIPFPDGTTARILDPGATVEVTKQSNSPPRAKSSGAARHVDLPL